MSLAQDFKDEMAQSVSIQAVAGHDGYSPSYGTAVVYACYVKQAVKNIRKDDGTEVVSTLQIYLDGHPAILSTAKITYGSSTPLILKIEKPFDEKGGAYSTIIFT
jgi:hypothetical protein